MITYTYRELLDINKKEARMKLVETYQGKEGNVSQTANELSCSRNTVKKWVRRYKEGGEEWWEDKSKRPKNSPHQTPEEIEDKIEQAREETGFGRVRLNRYLKKEYQIEISSSTIGNVLRRKGMTKQRERLGGDFEPVTRYNWDKVYPLKHWQIDVKEILDKKSLPPQVYTYLGELIKDEVIPPYQFTGLDPLTKTKFLAYAFSRTFTNGMCFLKLIHIWLRAFGFDHRLYFQTDWGTEFGGDSRKKLNRLQREIFNPLNTQLLKIGKGKWWENSYVERTHRTDDEELYITCKDKVNNLDQFFRMAFRYNVGFNLKRAHYGKPEYLEGLTPYQRVKDSYSWITKEFFLFPPLILDEISANNIFLTSGQDVLDYYFAVMFFAFIALKTVLSHEL